MTQQEVITTMRAIQEKQIARQPLTEEEYKIQSFEFRYGKFNGAKEYLKTLKPKGKSVTSILIHDAEKEAAQRIYGTLSACFRAGLKAGGYND